MHVSKTQLVKSIACVDRACHYCHATVCPNEAQTWISLPLAEACPAAEVAAACRKQEVFACKMS